MEKKSKAETFIGFAVKSGKYKTGFNSCETLKRAELIIVCKTASENSKKQALSLAGKLKCPLYMTAEKTLEGLTHKENAKVMAIQDKMLASAIITQAKDEFITVNQEN